MSGKLRFIPFMLGFMAVLAGLAAITGLVLKSAPGALGAALGVALMAAMFVASTLAIIWVEDHNRAMMMAAGLGAYFIKLWFLVVILRGVADSGWSGLTPMLFGVAAGVMGWVVGYAWWLWHAKIPYVDVDS